MYYLVILLSAIINHKEGVYMIMKKSLYFMFVLVLMFCFSSTVNANFLRKNSIKTCPNGITYGYYVKDGVKHWHVAQSCDSSSSWCNDGDELSGDPCPQGSQANTTTANVNTTRTTTTRPSTTTTTSSTTTTIDREVTTSISSTTTSSTIKKNENNDTKDSNKEGDSPIVDFIAWVITIGILFGSGYFIYKIFKKMLGK